MNTRIWLNKKSGESFLATPWWEPIKLDVAGQMFEELEPDLKKYTEGRKIAHGLLVQVGWLIQNQHGVWFGINMQDTEKTFDDMGVASCHERH